MDVCQVIPFLLKEDTGQTGMGVWRGSPFVHENLTPQRIWSLVMITVQKPEEHIECSPIPSRKQSLSIATDSGETSSQAFSSEARAGGHIC